MSEGKLCIMRFLGRFCFYISGAFRKGGRGRWAARRFQTSHRASRTSGEEGTFEGDKAGSAENITSKGGSEEEGDRRRSLHAQQTESEGGRRVTAAVVRLICASCALPHIATHRHQRRICASFELCVSYRRLARGERSGARDPARASPPTLPPASQPASTVPSAVRPLHRATRRPDGARAFRWGDHTTRSRSGGTKPSSPVWRSTAARRAAATSVVVVVAAVAPSLGDTTTTSPRYHRDAAEPDRVAVQPQDTSHLESSS